MATYTQNIALKCPDGPELFNIADWNANMRKLDEAYALLKDDSGVAQPVPARLVTYDNSTSGLQAGDVQAALDEIATGNIDTDTYYREINEDSTLICLTYGHTYWVISFGDTVYNVTWQQSIPDSGQEFHWEGGQPTFEPYGIYELSFLDLDCKWFKRW